MAWSQASRASAIHSAPMPSGAAAPAPAGWRVRVLSGDEPVVAWRTAGTLGFGARCAGRLSPETKHAIVAEAEARGPVVMVGDGVNDAAAIARATVGIGVHGGAEASPRGRRRVPGPRRASAHW